MDGSQSSSPPSAFVSPLRYGSASDRLFGQRTSLSPPISRMNINSVAPMSIPNSQNDPLAPPALPPPPIVPELDKGRDLGWEWQNRGLRPNDPHSRPVSPLSYASAERKHSRSGEGDLRMQAVARRESSTSTLRSPPSVDNFNFVHRDEGYGSLSGTSITQLQGERSLDRQNRKDSSHAYDKSLLSKIGGPKTPTRASTGSTTGSIEGTKPLALQALSISDSQSGVIVDSPMSSKWPYSPQSAVASPSVLSSASPRSLLDPHRNLTLDTASIGSRASSSASAAASASGSTGGTAAEGIGDTRFSRIEPRRTQRSDSSNLSLMMAYSSAGNPSPSSSTATAASAALGQPHSADGGKLKRGSDRGASFATSESGSGLAAPDSQPAPHPLAAGAPPVLRPHPNPHHRLDERAQPPPTFTTPTYHPPSAQLGTSRAAKGMLGKRKASSPARGPSASNKPAPPAKVERRQQPPPQHPPNKRGTPLSQTEYASSPAFPPAAPSGAPNGSYAQPPGFAVAMRSGNAAPENSHQQHPTAPSASARPDEHPSPYPNPGAIDPGLRSADDATYNAQLASSAQRTAAAAQQISAENNRMKQGGQPKLQVNMHICNCCPKKPRKFDTYEALRQHQSEKQYVCQYCQNRFKNKNEAERHQNSLHLRRHSWSCATLENYEAAFHPCNATPPNLGSSQSSQQQQQQPPPPPSNEPAQYDVCGYCGVNFPNLPAPDWVARSQHLTNDHKFGECNQSKKFFRADHFRQHLKHSHGGTSGKWTNMLEAACMKDEPPPPTTAEVQAQAQAQAQAQQSPQMVGSVPQQQQRPPDQHVQPPRLSPQKEAPPPQQHPQAQAQAPALSHLQAAQLQGAPVANMMRQGPYSMMGASGGANAGGGGDFHFSTMEDMKHDGE